MSDLLSAAIQWAGSGANLCELTGAIWKRDLAATCAAAADQTNSGLHQSGPELTGAGKISSVGADLRGWNFFTKSRLLENNFQSVASKHRVLLARSASLAC